MNGTIILSSSSKFITPANLDNHLSKRMVDCKIVYITTAANEVHDKSYVVIQKQKMEKWGLNYVEIDIAGKRKIELKDMLRVSDIVMVEGGNTFYLLKAIRESGFGEVIKQLIEKGVVYIGASAGSYVACPSIIMATWSDRFDRYGINDYTAMKLVPFLIKAHYKPSLYGFLKEKAKELNYPLRVLTDNQALLVQDNKVKLLGKGEEIIF